MKLCELMAQYVAHKQSMGMRFRTEQRILKSFCRTMGDIAMADIQADPVLAFLAGTGSVTRFWHRKYEVLVGFYRYAIARGYCTVSPLPTHVPKRPPAFVPHIYSHLELQRLLEATSVCEHPCSKVRAYTFRALILVLYGAGLRISEALALTLNDVNLSTALIQIRETKFYKSRLVPFGPKLGTLLAEHLRQRQTALTATAADDQPLFCLRGGPPINPGTVSQTFHAMVPSLSLQIPPSISPPRLHDLRHYSGNRIIPAPAKPR